MRRWRAVEGRFKIGPQDRVLPHWLWLAVLVALLNSGCRRYGEFTLPAVGGGDANLRFAFEERPEPVLPRGEARDVLNPSVAGNRMFYSEFDGRTWHTAEAELAEGRWVKTKRVLSPDPGTWEGSYIAANGAAMAIGGEIWYWYEAGEREALRVGLARNWRKEPEPVLEPGPYMSWDERAVADPYVLRIEPYFYLYYLGQDRAHRQQIGVARSLDGVHWQKLRTNPILEMGDAGAFDENGLGEPAVWNSGGFYWMLYTGRDVAENRRLGLARSTDGVHWTKLPTVFSGASAWDSKVICDADVAFPNVYFGGGNVARPDENINGQIGSGTLHPVNATVGK